MYELKIYNGYASIYKRFNKDQAAEMLKYAIDTSKLLGYKFTYTFTKD